MFPKLRNNSSKMKSLNQKEKHNATKLIAAATCTKLGDVLVDPKTVLTWLLAQLGTSGAVISWLVPIRESGSMLPQLFISGWVKRVKLRKHVFVLGALAQAIAVAAMGFVALFAPPTIAGLTMLVAVAFLSVARAFCSISSKDVVGRTIPKGARGRVGGLSASISGVISTIAASSLIWVKDDTAVQVLAWVVLGASVLWILGSAFYLSVDETASNPSENDFSSDMLKRLGLVQNDALFRRFIIARMLLLGSALGSPLFVILAGGKVLSLGAFVIASGIAKATSSVIWGNMADRSSHLTMSAGGIIVAITAALGLALELSSARILDHPLSWPMVFLIFNIGYAGIRVGRKTWVIDAAEGDQRTDYVSASNTVIAVAIIVMGAVGSLLQASSPLLLLGTYSGLCFLGAWVALSLRID